MRNIEELRNYFLGKDPQLKEVLADNSLRLCGIKGKYYVLRTELIARLNQLKDYLDDKDADLQAEIDDIIRDLGAETTARIDGDTALGQRIDNVIANYVKKAGDTMTGSLAIGSTSVATGNRSIAVGNNCTASANTSQAFGNNTTASGLQSHAEGHNTEATYNSSHAEGTGTRSVSQSSHAEGFGTVARGRAQHVEGSYNIIDTTTSENTATFGEYLHIVGNGADANSRSNAHTLDLSGNAWFSGDVYVGSTSGTHKDAGSQKLATESYVNNLVSTIPEFDVEVVNTLPTEDISTTTIYLVPSADPQTANAYDEFIYVNNNWEQIGSTAIDLSNYYTKGQVNTLFSQKTFTTTLDQDITIYEDTAAIAGLNGTGWYFTGNHTVSWNNGNDTNTILYNNGLFYYFEDTELQGDNYIWFAPVEIENASLMVYAVLYYDLMEQKWTYTGYDITMAVNDSSNDMQIPTAAAVNAAIANAATFPTQTSPVRIWDLEPGTYKLPESCVIYYYGASDTSNSYTTTSLGYLFVVKQSTTYKQFFLMEANATAPKMLGGYSTSTAGAIGGVDLSKTYQEALTAGANISISSNTISTVGSTITELDTSPVYAWTLDPGIYKIKGDNNGFDFYYKENTPRTFYKEVFLIIQNTEDTNNDGIKYFYIFEPPLNAIDINGTNNDYADFDIGWSAKIGSANAKGKIKQVKFVNIQYKSNLVTSVSSGSTDDQYPSAKCLYDNLKAFTGTDGNTAGTKGTVPAPATTDAGKFLCADGTWATPSGGGGGSTITYGTTDLTPGVSPLNDGEFYFVYE